MNLSRINHLLIVRPCLLSGKCSRAILFIPGLHMAETKGSRGQADPTCALFILECLSCKKTGPEKVPQGKVMMFLLELKCLSIPLIALIEEERSWVARSTKQDTLFGQPSNKKRAPV